MSGGHTWTYQWNALNQLTAVSKDGQPLATFKYDALGRRIEKVAGGVTYRFVYSGQDILREAQSSGATYTYIHGPGIDEPLARLDQAGVATYYHADGLGSIVATTDASGTVTSRRQYDAWGNLEQGADQPGYAFTGREWDPETGLYYYRARYYDPKIGRFISEDPIGLAGGINLLQYVSNNPTGRVDPFGLTDINWYPENSYSKMYAAMYNTGDDVFSIGAHSRRATIDGPAYSLMEEKPDGTYVQHSLDDLARIIRNSEKWKRGHVQRIEITSCMITNGERGKGDSPLLSFAQRLANRLGIGVFGATVSTSPTLDTDGPIPHFKLLDPKGMWQLIPSQGMR